MITVCKSVPFGELVTKPCNYTLENVQLNLPKNSDNLPELCMCFGVSGHYLPGTCTYLQLEVILPGMCM